MSLSKEQRREISARLPHGSRAEIARRLGVSRMAVCAWLNGATNSRRIECAVVEMLVEIVEQEKEINERLRAILSE